MLSRFVASNRDPQIIFITGTDTGVGKTVLTTLLLAHLRQSDRPAFALKPFCSGGRADAQVLHGLQDGDLTLDEINPFYFSEPLAPLVAARLHRRKISLAQTLRQIHLRLEQIRVRTNNQRIHQSTNPVLLIEGAGGLLAPLGECFSAADLVKKLCCEVIIVAANRLGTLNHAALTGHYISQYTELQRVTVVLVDIERTSCNSPHRSSERRQKDHASRTNPKILAELLAPIPIFHLPHLPELQKTLGKTERKSLLITCAKKLKKTLAQIIE